MEKTRKVRMNVSIASETWAFQPGMIAEVDAGLARQWLRSGLASSVDKNTPVSSPDLLADLSAEEALQRICESCNQRRAHFVFQNVPYCERCYRAMLA